LNVIDLSSDEILQVAKIMTEWSNKLEMAGLLG